VDPATYPGALDVFESGNCRPDSQPHQRVRYVMPAVANPTGATMSLAQREQCLEAEVILEDDAYGDLLFSGLAPRPLFSFAPEKVYFMGTFSKTLAPGLRVGWLIAPKAMHGRILEAKARRDLQAGGLAQGVVERVLGLIDFEKRLAQLRAHYRLRCERMLAALSQLPGAHFLMPAGGFSVWIETDFCGDDAAWLYSALEHGVAFDPGELFCVNQKPNHPLAMRLSFSCVPLDQIELGIERLASAMRRARRRALAA
jgi:2-aminoadipate transaminase